MSHIFLDNCCTYHFGFSAKPIVLLLTRPSLLKKKFINPVICRLHHVWLPRSTYVHSSQNVATTAQLLAPTTFKPKVQTRVHILLMTFFLVTTMFMCSCLHVVQSHATRHSLHIGQVHLLVKDISWTYRYTCLYYIAAIE